MTEREKLEVELKNKCGFRYSSPLPSREYLNIDDVLDYVLSDRKRICEPLIEHINVSRSLEELKSYSYVVDVDKAMQKTLKLAGLGDEK